MGCGPRAVRKIDGFPATNEFASGCTVAGNAYSINVLAPAAHASWLLQGTPWQLPHDTLDNIAFGLAVLRTYSASGKVARAVSGRLVGLDNSVFGRDLFCAYLQVADMAARGIYSRGWHTSFNAIVHQMQQFPPDSFDGVREADPGCINLWARYREAYPPPPGLSSRQLGLESFGRGAAVFPYAGMATIRFQSGWVVVTKGYDNNVKNTYEMHASNPPTSNHHGVYQSAGTLTILREGAEELPSAGGCSLGGCHGGFDWFRMPGATTPHRTAVKPIKDVITKDTLQPHGEWLGGEDNFVGGVRGEEDRHGGALAWGFKMVDMRAPSLAHALTGHKSVVYLKDAQTGREMMLAIGSDIHRPRQWQEESDAIETTLFQTYLAASSSTPSSQLPVWINGWNYSGPQLFLNVSSFASPAGQALNQSMILDTVGNGYVFVASGGGGAGLRFRRHLQTSLDEKSKHEESGVWDVGYVDHGKFPHNASYQYVLLPNSTAEELMRFNADEHYQILSATDGVHSVLHRASGKDHVGGGKGEQVSVVFFKTGASPVSLRDRIPLIRYGRTALQSHS